MRMTRLTTIARTGRRMKRSVNFMACLSGSRAAASSSGVRLATALSTMTREPLRSLKAPALTTSSPAFTPSTIGDEVAARARRRGRTAGARSSPACRRAVAGARRLRPRRRRPSRRTTRARARSPGRRRRCASPARTTATFTNMPGRSFSSVFGTAARSLIVRVVGVDRRDRRPRSCPSRGGARSRRSIVTRTGMPIVDLARGAAAAA